MRKTALILAGGSGERFWPLSRKAFPKQFLCLTGDGISLLQHTVNRISPVIAPENIFISTLSEYKERIKEQLSGVPEENIISEPVRKNTAPAIAWAMYAIKSRYEDALTCVLPSDHIINQNSTFLCTLEDAFEAAEKSGKIIALGVEPTRPETGYGYIRINGRREKYSGCSVYDAEEFIEKPDSAAAVRFLSDGNYLWNSGMYIAKISSLLGEYEKYLPDIISGCESVYCGNAKLMQVYSDFPCISVDYSIMERSEKLAVIAGAFNWDDAGSFRALERISHADGDSNRVLGNVVCENCTDVTAVSTKRLVAGVGVSNLLIVETDDVVLVCGKEHTGEIDAIVKNLRKNGAENLF